MGKIGSDIIGPSTADQLLRREAAQRRERIGPIPGPGTTSRSRPGLDTLEDLHDMAQPLLCRGRAEAVAMAEGAETQSNRPGKLLLGDMELIQEGVRDDISLVVHVAAFDSHDIV